MRLTRILLILTTTACLAARGDAAASGWSGAPLEGDEVKAGVRNASWVAKRVEAWQPTEEERAFDQIGWAKEVREAARLSRHHGRPMFLFTYDGTSLKDYRC
jgi:hypothetical protein